MKKRILLSLLILWPMLAYCQLQDKYGCIYTSMNDSIITYNTQRGEKIEVKLGQIYYMDGENSLKEYLKKKYYKYDASEEQYRIIFYILFNSKFKIKEVRGVPLTRYNTASIKKRVDLYIKGLKNSPKRWNKVTRQEWYVYSFSMTTD